MSTARTTTRARRSTTRTQAALSRGRLALKNPTTVIGVLFLLLFSYLIVVPVVTMLNDGIRVQYEDTARTGQQFGELTTYNFERVVSSPVSQQVFWKPLTHTVTIAFSSLAIALVIGALLAWLLTRTNMWGRRWFATALIVPYMVPSMAFALAWTAIFKNRAAGGEPGWLESMGFTPPDWLAYGQLPITIVLSLHYIPFVILLFGNALRRFDSQLEESARIMGATSGVFTRRILLPLMRPSLMSAATLVFARCIGDFGVAYILGQPVGFDVLATSLFRSVGSGQSGVAAVLAMAIILICLISVFVEIVLAKEARRFVTIGGKGSMDKRTSLGRWRLPATGFATGVFVISAVIPLLALFLTTIMHIPGRFSANNFTLDYWIGHDLATTAMRNGILLTGEFWSSAWNSIWMAGVAATCAGIFGLLVGYVITRTTIPMLGGTLRFITFLPYLVPAVAFAVAYLSLFAVARGPVPALYGTAIILVLCMAVEGMPFASRAGTASMMQLGKEPEEAAQIAGAGWWKRMIKIVLPIQKGPLIAAILLPFIGLLKAVSLVVILAVPGTDLLTTYAVRLVDYGYAQAANAVTLMACVIAFVATLAVQRLGRSNLADGLGG
ncbi:iron ABC transporter permease [Aeromicrobium sp. YIM 150415]|uniref:ABC transporter permease n=1 Tax=Aeromicrobium sp. YIM 150415 TaxID=2803912 RepID=UPI001963F6CD|nr:iron ABC transporter permease [Aeromicrobium sp. YIM 150415]MBM9463495.1 iron ABC transporter permease [Aeromicrobium sp. YIM 150415]